jgi:hypothetical protein
MVSFIMTPKPNQPNHNGADDEANVDDVDTLASEAEYEADFINEATFEENYDPAYDALPLGHPDK